MWWCIFFPANWIYQFNLHMLLIVVVQAFIIICLKIKGQYGVAANIKGDNSYVINGSTKQHLR